MTAVSMQAANCPIHENVVNFDTDSGQIGIDNRCTACISHRIDDIVGTMVESNRTIQGFAGGNIKNVKKGTLKWE